VEEEVLAIKSRSDDNQKPMENIPMAVVKILSTKLTPKFCDRA
jgi:hypothetical protein